MLRVEQLFQVRVSYQYLYLYFSYIYLPYVCRRTFRSCWMWCKTRSSSAAKWTHTSSTITRTCKRLISLLLVLCSLVSVHLIFDCFSSRSSPSHLRSNWRAVLCWAILCSAVLLCDMCSCVRRFNFVLTQNRGQKLLAYMAHIAVNGPFGSFPVKAAPTSVQPTIPPFPSGASRRLASQTLGPHTFYYLTYYLNLCAVVYCTVRVFSSVQEIPAFFHVKAAEDNKMDRNTI